MGAHLRLRARIAALVAAGAIVVAIGVALLLSNTIKLRDSADATLRSDAYFVAVINLERLVVDAETGLRGYVITGNPLFLGPLREAQAGVPGAVAKLQQSASRDHAFERQARFLVQASRAYLSLYVPQLLAMGSHNLSGIRSLSATLTGKQLVDQVRARTAVLERLVSARQTARQRAAHDLANHSVRDAIVVLVLLVLLTVLLGFVLGRLAVAREVARTRSETTTRTLQQSLLPRTMPQIPGCEIAVRFKPAGAGELVGGDFYDVFAVTPNRWALVVGDVCGKGAEAAAVTAMARWTLRSLADEPFQPASALRFLNDAMIRQDLDRRFITVAYMLVRIEAGVAHVSVACAGHPAPILIPGAGEPTPVTATGSLLGVWPEIKLRPSELQLNPGDSLVAYTDGVSDQGPESSLATPVELLRNRGPNASAEQLVICLEQHAPLLSEPQRDDIAILAVRFMGDQVDVGPTTARQRRVDETVVHRA